mmetsp:Transcript_4884/g.11634  ORF Transcript_4884/g.11634 Transcript_4884/m.11634 type:complete len:84 (-) Transcript_4884:378-629(-)
MLKLWNFCNMIAWSSATNTPQTDWNADKGDDYDQCYASTTSNPVRTLSGNSRWQAARRSQKSASRQNPLLSSSLPAFITPAFW